MEETLREHITKSYKQSKYLVGKKEKNQVKCTRSISYDSNRGPELLKDSFRTVLVFVRQRNGGNRPGE